MSGSLSHPENPAERTAAIVSTFCEIENDQVVLRFGGPIRVPTSKYNGRTRRTDTIPYATINATVEHASIEDAGESLMCFVAVDMDEIERIGVDPKVVYTEPVGEAPERWMIDIHASRELFTAVPDDYDLTIEEAEAAVAAGREEDVLPPWDGLPTATTTVKQTKDCHRRAIESDHYIQYSSPSHELGELIDVRRL